MAPTTTPGPECPTCPPGVCKPDDRCPKGPCLQCNPVLLPHPDYCEMFLKCTNGFACEMKCPAGLHWSTAGNRCDWPFLGDCATGLPPPPSPSPADCPLDYRCPAFDNPWDPTLLPHPGDCTKFIKCENRRGCVRSCPEGLHWSVAHNRCEWPNVAGCDPKIPIEPECPICPCTPCRMRGDRHPCVDNSACKRNMLSSLSLPYEQDYTRFYECLGGKACLLDCPRGTRFNRSRQRCEDV
ncbi:conserved hypothetical protein [Culex quinquefasciatus]|uniref:Chitin-binding type-2 domain-containing protein n=1 Tax=Culex quinquefasciatus TaxID=7176 RepID=B0WLF5_CULQU|nr:conserved hypothetical protein [Culex quinquefasciatus]|eukprot:XP_001849539.1 conserved hypothetical protein [Culex quinquefasciatus]